MDVPFRDKWHDFFAVNGTVRTRRQLQTLGPCRIAMTI